MSKPPAMRALLVTTDYPPEIGGLQTYAWRIARELPRGLLAQVLVGRCRSHQALPRPQDGVVLFSRYGRSRLQALLWSVWSIPYARLRHGINFQLHMQWSTALSSLLMKMILRRGRYIVLIHGAEILDPGRPWLAAVKANILKHADAIVAGSQHTAALINQLQIPYKRLEVISYGNPLDGDLHWETARNPGSRPVQETPRLLCMHRLVTRKGTALLLEALAEMRAYPWTLDIVGEGNESTNLKDQVAANGLGKRVQFHSTVSQQEKIGMLSAATLFILPSLPPDQNNHFEGLGLTLLEAQSLGLPVLAARTGGIPEALREGLTGVLFQAGDRDDLKSKLIGLLGDPEHLSKLGAAGPTWVMENFRWKNSLAKLSTLMVEIGPS